MRSKLFAELGADLRVTVGRMRFGAGVVAMVVLFGSGVPGEVV